MSSVSEQISSPGSVNPIVVDEGIVDLPGLFPLHFGGTLSDVCVAWRLAGAANAPIVAVLGGISAGRKVFATSATEQGWWKEVVGPDCALDARAFRILGIDFLGGSGDTTGPRTGQQDFPSVSAYDQAALLAQLLQKLSLGSLHAVVGASYGGMVALAFAERYAELVERIVVISAADRAHPLATAWRSVQRATVRALSACGQGAEGLKLARALAMATYRSPSEFAQRFDSPPARTATGFRFPVEDYLYARGRAYADSYVPEAFVCLSESIDLHRIDPTRIRVPTTLVAVREDQLVPLADMQALRDRLSCQNRLVELSSLFGHDAFLKEATTLRAIFAEALQ
ncbi:MAG: homoserine O-succinyltransferase [Candidatus Obscuribacterales bacterium]|nr:homoserine O-succinyltransferase [Steroidobacteraceae bacterium]